MNLEQVLNGDKPAPAVVEQAAPPVETKVETTEVKADRTRDEKGKFAKGETAEPPAAKTVETAEPDEVTGLKSGISAERKKRQEAEARAKKLEEQLNQRIAAQEAPRLTDEPETPEERAQIDYRVNQSVELFKDLHTDFDEVMQGWADEVRQNPWILRAAERAKNPAKYAYSHMKKIIGYSKIGDPEEFEKSVEERVRAKLEAEYSTRQRPSVPPPSLATAPSSGRISESAWSGPTPLNDIFKRK